MEYIRFNIESYKAIKNSNISIGSDPVPIIGVNESGKTSVLEAIARFDHRNDSMAAQRGWKFNNRYKPQEKEFCITSEISIKQSEIEDIIVNYLEEEKQKLLTLIKTDNLVIKRYFRKNQDGESINYHINEEEDPVIEKFCIDIINRLPRIFYFDSFLENKFNDHVDFDQDYINNPDYVLNEHQIIIENMFLKAGYSLKEFLTEDDDNTKDTYLTEINKETTKDMIDDWIKMHLRDDEVGEEKLENIEIRLLQDTQNKMSIKINVFENFEDDNKQKHSISMKLSERSLGFIWFFNFSAKKCYGARSQEKFIYLFDEPGSYLHNSAQSILLKAIKDLSVDHPVIFSTHSEFLLDPEIININKIKIANKSDRQINLVPLSEAKGKRNQGAMTTLYNALRTKISVNSTLSKKVIVFEGITDFYFWKMILPENIVILPGFGAEQNEYLISIAIGTSKRYTAVFDGDNAGDKAIEKYKKFFGNKESENWIQYCDKNENRILLEGMFSKNDSDRLKKLANLSDLKKTITYIFYSKKEKKDFKKNIDMETKENINKNIMNINKILVTRIPLLTV